MWRIKSSSVRHSVRMSTAPTSTGMTLFGVGSSLPVSDSTCGTHIGHHDLLALWRNKCFSALRLASVWSQHRRLLGERVWIAEANGFGFCEVPMQFTRCSSVRSGADVLSGILNCVCPDCGGRMGERGKEFRCQGECHQDWRQAWEQAAVTLVPRSKRGIRRG